MEMTTKNDAFYISGETFTRSWAGDNSGRYEWTSADGRLVCWCSKRSFEIDRNGIKKPVHEYSATLDGYPSTKTWPRLSDAMAAAVMSRMRYDQRSAA